MIMKEIVNKSAFVKLCCMLLNVVI